MTNHISTVRTPWTDILAAQQGDPGVRARCLTEIAEKYYGPVRAYIGAIPGVNNNPEVVDDLVQGFFLKFLEKEILNHLNRDKGSFRQFLKTAVRNYVKDEKAKAGRNNPHSPLMRHYSLPAGGIPGRQPPTPEEEFDRCWAQKLVRDAAAAFKQDCFDHSKEHYYAVFERHALASDDFGNPDYAATARILGMSEKDVANYLHRAKKRFRALLPETIARMELGKEDADQEMAELQRYFQVL